ncbi:MAG: sodium:proton antiporter [Candidatus Thermoplasmatota archaeon]|jgi:NhaP-type Na+/H+ or K+/H+ antiporter|nr:sodium:proton antiporter [Candidatus Thermoplasmatota archaeon]MCL5785567.1 sodium:proton antiporter [Candidatus Thermoplasmatota archaeon]
MTFSLGVYPGFLEISLILILAAFAIPISRKISVVDLPVLIGIGFLVGPVLGIIGNSFSIGLLSNFQSVGLGLLGITIILYAESHTINFRIINRELVRIAALDTIGLIMTAVIAALLFSLLSGAPLVIGFIFGAIIAPTDPASLIPVFRKVRVEEEISGIMVGESLFNDPLGILLVSLGVAVIVPGASYVSLFSLVATQVGTVLAPVFYLILQLAIPSVTGVAIGFLVIYLNKLFNFDNLLVGFMLGIIIMEFTLFEAAGITPFPALIATGAVVGNYSDKGIFWEREASFQQNLSFLSRAIIFILLGGVLTLGDMYLYMVPGILLAMAVMFVARPVAVFASLGLVSKYPSRYRIDKKIASFMGLVGPRGVVSVVMSLIPYTVGLANNNALLMHWGQMIYVTVSYVVIFSIVMQTIYAPYLAKKLLPKQEI